MSFLFQEIKSTGSTRATRAKTLGVSAKTVERYQKGHWPNPIRQWLKSDLGQRVLLALLVDQAGADRIRVWLQDFENAETPAV